MSGPSSRVHRYDRASLAPRKAVRTDEGFLSAAANITRWGVFTYRDNKGNTWNEYRPPEEVFSPESLASFNQRPVTLNHPGGEGLVTPQNAKQLTVGNSSNTRAADDQIYVSSDLFVMADEAIKAIDGGKAQISNGYWCDREEAPPGFVARDPISFREIPCKYIQRNIRGNHVAIVDQARAGPGARIMLDSSAEEITNDAPEAQRNNTMALKKITIDGVSVEVEENAAQLFERHDAAQKKTIDTQTARADAAESSVKKLTADLAVANDQQVFNSKVTERVKLVGVAERHSVKSDGLDNAALRRAIVTKLDASISLEGKTDTYVEVMFDLLAAKNPVTAQLDSAAAAAKKGATVGTKLDEAAIEKKKEENRSEFFSHDASAKGVNK